MVSKTSIVHLYIFTLQLVIVENTTQTGCYPDQFNIDPGCKTSEKMYPKTLKTWTLQQPRNCTPQGVTCSSCCQTSGPDVYRIYELPAQGLTIPGRDQKYKTFVTQCIGRQGCSLGGKIQMNWNCVLLEFECVDDNQILDFTRDSTLLDTQVFLIHNQKARTVDNYHCVAYTCQSSIDVKLVGNTMNTSSCTLVLSEEGGSLAVFKCEDTMTNNTLYESNSNKINITLNMISSDVKELLWIRVTASNGGLVSVACGSKIPSNATQNCPKTTTITTTVVPSSDKDTTVMSPTTDTTGTTNLGTTLVAKPQSGITLTPTKESNIPVIGAAVGGLVAVLIVSAISFVVYKKCHKMNKIEDESALATNEDVNVTNPLETPESRGGWVGSARGTGVVPDSQTDGDYTPLPATFGAALHHMPRPTTSLPPLRHS